MSDHICSILIVVNASTEAMLGWHIEGTCTCGKRWELQATDEGLYAHEITV